MEICFLFHVYNEVESAKTLADSIRNFYPNHQVICIFDGLKSEELKNYLISKNVTIIEGSRLLPQINGAAWIIRELETFLKLSKQSAYIHIDPDSQVLRPFASFPSPDVDLAGTIVDYQDGIRTVDGACRWVSRPAAVKIFISNLLNNDRYRQSHSFGYQRFAGSFLQPGETADDTWLLEESKVIGLVSNILKLKIEDWSEVSCNASPELDSNKNIAVFHPLKYPVQLETPFQPPVLTLEQAKTKVLQQIVDYAATCQQQILADYSPQEQKTWDGSDGKVAEAKAILEKGIDAAKYLKVEARATTCASTPSEIETATIMLSKTIVRKNDEWRSASGLISGIRARKYAEVQGLTNIADVQNYPVTQGWGTRGIVDG